jgi:hypothetical protein
MKDIIGTYVRIADCARMASQLFTSPDLTNSEHCVRDALVKEAFAFGEYVLDAALLNRHIESPLPQADFEEDF